MDQIETFKKELNSSVIITQLLSHQKLSLSWSLNNLRTKFSEFYVWLLPSPSFSELSLKVLRKVGLKDLPSSLPLSSSLPSLREIPI